MKKLMVFCMPAAALFLSACGYTMRSAILHDVRRLHIASFENRTYEHGLDADLERHVAREFITDGNFTVTGAEHADALIRGEVYGYVLEPYAYGEDEADVEQYRLVIMASVELKHIGSKAVWREAAMAGEALYRVEGRFSMTEGEAREEALRDLARRIVLRTAGAW